MSLSGWHGLLGTYSGVVLVTVAMLPLVVQAVWSLVRRRIARGSTPSAGLADVHRRGRDRLRDRCPGSG